jgi:hypothetical protein
MRALSLALLTSVGIGLAGATASIAAPANGTVTGITNSTNQLTQKAAYWDDWRYRHHWGWHRYWHRGWCEDHPYRCGRY